MVFWIEQNLRVSNVLRSIHNLKDQIEVHDYDLALQNTVEDLIISVIDKELMFHR